MLSNRWSDATLVHSREAEANLNPSSAGPILAVKLKHVYPLLLNTIMFTGTFLKRFYPSETADGGATKFWVLKQVKEKCFTFEKWNLRLLPTVAAGAI